MSESWLPIIGYEGHYEVSDLGRVKSLARWTHHKNGVRQLLPERIMVLSPHHPRTPYPKVSLCKNSVQRSHAVHRLVLEAFVGPCPDGMEACHENGDHSNSSLANLRWDTHRENWRDSARHGTAQVQAPGTHCQKGHQFTEENTRIQYVQGRTRRHCRTCERARYESEGHYSRDTHCRNGHEVPKDGEGRDAKGYRQCAICRSESRVREHAKRRETRRAARSIAIPANRG